MVLSLHIPHYTVRSSGQGCHQQLKAMTTAVTDTNSTVDPRIQVNLESRLWGVSKCKAYKTTTFSLSLNNNLYTYGTSSKLIIQSVEQQCLSAVDLFNCFHTNAFSKHIYQNTWRLFLIQTHISKKSMHLQLIFQNYHLCSKLIRQWALFVELYFFKNIQ